MYIVRHRGANGTQPCSSPHMFVTLQSSEKKFGGIRF
jgi:hypothetical protein